MWRAAIAGFLGHPVGLAYLSFAEAWERFSYYGMLGMLTLYLTTQLLLPGHVETSPAWRVFAAGSNRCAVRCRSPRSRRSLAVTRDRRVGERNAWDKSM